MAHNLKIKRLILTKQLDMGSITTASAVAVTITSDLVCPWCWVGLRKLQQASEDAKVDVDITWKPFMLRPNTPHEGVPKGGTPTSRVPAHLKAAGKAVGIDFSGLTDRTPSTRDFHATMKYLLDEKVDQTPFQEAVFNAYFTKGVFPDQPAMLTCADKAGVSDQVKKLYEEKDILEKYRHDIVAEANYASRQGISGVPSFTFGDDKRPAFSGAQNVESFVAHLKQNAAKLAAQEKR